MRLRPPGTPGHWLGVDNQGRDILSRLIYGARYTLLCGITPVVLGAVISVPLGMFGAWYPVAGSVIMRSMDVLFAFPMALLAILLAALMGPGIGNMMIALVVTLIPITPASSMPPPVLNAIRPMSRRQGPWPRRGIRSSWPR